MCLVTKFAGWASATADGDLAETRLVIAIGFEQIVFAMSVRTTDKGAGPELHESFTPEFA